MEIFVVYPQIEAASVGDAGRVVEGFYTLDNDVVTMTNDIGVPVRDSNGKHITQKLAKGETPQRIAARLTLKIFYSRQDGMADFRRVIHPHEYPPCPC